MPIIGWIRDLFGIQKDMYETKETRLKIDEMERKERERTLVTPATLEDVKKYDPKTRGLMRAVRERRRDEDMGAIEPGLMIAALTYICRRIKDSRQDEDFFGRIHRALVSITLTAILLPHFTAKFTSILRDVFGW